jgi:hypothetical protein
LSKPVNDTEDSDVNMPRRRRDLLRELVAVREVAFSKYDNPRTKNVERQAWGRLITSTVSAAEILKDVAPEEVDRHLAEGWEIASTSISTKFVRMVLRRAPASKVG